MAPLFAQRGHDLITGILRSHFRHFRGSIYVIGHLNRKRLSRLLPLIDMSAAQWGSLTSDEKGVSEHHVLVDVSGAKPTFSFRDPDEVRRIAEEYGESIPHAITRSGDEW